MAGGRDAEHLSIMVSVAAGSRSSSVCSALLQIMNHNHKWQCPVVTVTTVWRHLPAAVWMVWSRCWSEADTDTATLYHPGCCYHPDTPSGHRDADRRGNEAHWCLDITSMIGNWIMECCWRWSIEFHWIDDDCRKFDDPSSYNISMFIVSFSEHGIICPHKS